MDVKRGEIVYIDIKNRDNRSSIQTGRRPYLIVQNDKGNESSPTTIVVPITSKKDGRNYMPVHIGIMLDKPSTILCEQIMTVDKKYIETPIEKRAMLSKRKMKQVEVALCKSLQISVDKRYV